VKIADPDRTAIILDHAVPAPSLADANAGTTARAFARESWPKAGSTPESGASRRRRFPRWCSTSSTLAVCCPGWSATDTWPAGGRGRRDDRV
jgi:hypothetical protein